MSSIAGLIGIGDIASFQASNAGTADEGNGAITYVAEKTQMNSIHPACIWTPRVENHLCANAPYRAAAKAAARAAHPIGTKGEPDDIGWAVVRLASNKAKFVAGAEIVVDGSYTVGR